MNRVLQTKEVYITQNFSEKHRGLDIVGLEGTAHVTDGIVAHSAGRVISAVTGHVNDKGSSGTASYGNYVRIEHEDGWTTLYAHLASVAVKKGDIVTAGQKIGVMGNTGNSYGAHLHWEVRTPDNVKVDPAPYLNVSLPGADEVPADTQPVEPPAEEVTVMGRVVDADALIAWIEENAKSVVEPEGPKAPEPEAAWEAAIGDQVSFIGTVHYSNPNAENGPACRPGLAVITDIHASGKHPFHLKAVPGGGSNVYGWVDADTFAKA